MFLPLARGLPALGLALGLMCVELTAQITIAGVTTGAGYLPGITRPGGISTVFCRGLVIPTGVTNAVGRPLETQLAGVRVGVNGVFSPLLAVADVGAYQQINFIVPNLPDYTRAPITITVSQSGLFAGVKLQQDTPFNGYPADLFRDELGYGVILHADGSLVTTTAPAQRGEILVTYATGMGAVEPPVAMGTIAPLQQLSSLVLYPGEVDGVKIFFCAMGVACQPASAISSTSLFAGLAPGSAGVYRIQFAVPASAPLGDVDLGVLRTYCYNAPCTLQSPFQQLFASQRVKIAIR